MAASHLLVVYPTLRPNCQWLGPVMTRFETAEREVWLTIDDGVDPDSTSRILDLLDRHGARATFFVTGLRVRKHPELAREILGRGHSIGNHSDAHPSGLFWCLPPAAIAREIDGCSSAIREATGTEPQLFRAPVGMKNPFVHPLLSARRLVLTGWTARGFDAVMTDRAAVVRRILRDVSPGAIVLVHEGARNVAVIEDVLGALTKDGYTCVVPEMGRLRA
jgi:peptidoglycan/xylan/chitin deacetylase (PgdA/CDA1 family)